MISQFVVWGVLVLALSACQSTEITQESPACSAKAEASGGGGGAGDVSGGGGSGGPGSASGEAACTPGKTTIK